MIASLGVAGALTGLGGLAALYAAPYVSKYAERGRLRERCLRQRAIALTYDDGPSREVTPRLLDLLARHRAPATFFLRGDNATANPDLAERIVREGHEVGCHSARHLHAWKRSPWSVTQDMLEGYRLLSPWITRRALYRPPFGKPCLPVLWMLRRQGSRMAWWTLDSGDTLPTRMPIDQVVAAAAGGGVVLMHDWKRNLGNHGEHVLEMTDRLLALASREGLAVKRFGDLYTQS
ncbi:MAG TPA: polysaccharide deacetylase family protein [Burkholderiales bacterium]|nr:polysaccharide deacetylase family protein [Burkholderiales bacterium]